MDNRNCYIFLISMIRDLLKNLHFLKIILLRNIGPLKCMVSVIYVVYTPKLLFQLLLSYTAYKSAYRTDNCTTKVN